MLRIEGWLPHSHKHCILGHHSNLTDYYSRKLRIRYGTKEVCLIIVIYSAYNFVLRLKHNSMLR